MFDIDKIADKSQNLPHMLPSPMQFERQVSDLGVTNDDHIVLYDQSGIYFASARVWWTFRVRVCHDALCTAPRLMRFYFLGVWT